MWIFILVLLFLSYWFINNVLSIKPKSIQDKHIVITGGSSGIGKSVGIEAAKRGAHVTILARDKVKLKSTEEEIVKACVFTNQKVQSISLDVTDYENVVKTLTDIDKNLPVFMLVNCAGMAICGRVEELSQGDIKKLTDLNFLGTVYPIKTLIPFMKKRKDGVIVLTASQAALLGIYGLATYSATKYALRGFAEGLEMELRPFNISVTVSLPPDTDTPGLSTENETKSKITKLISESGGLFQPEIVANQLINDALEGKFYSHVGFESFMLSTLCCGMTPFKSFIEVLLQTLLLGPFRLVSSFYILKFRQVIKDNVEKED